MRTRSRRAASTSRRAPGELLAWLRAIGQGHGVALGVDADEVAHAGVDVELAPAAQHGGIACGQSRQRGAHRSQCRFWPLQSLADIGQQQRQCRRAVEL
jgi:hypothetical protein